jgi:hypothetical protein
MNADLLALAELLLIFALVLWFGISQLRALKRHGTENSRAVEDHADDRREDG